MEPHAVVLFNLGGPDSLESVEPFLVNLFSDPDIMSIPVGQQWLAKFIARRRAPKVRERYGRIGGKSPINQWTEIQRSMLQDELARKGLGGRVFTAMRYWHPMIHETAQTVQEAGFKQIILLPLYPQYSVTTTGSAFNEWKRRIGKNTASQIYVQAYYDHPKYIAALNERIDEAVSRFPETVRDRIRIVFSAHSTPVRLEKKGDPYRSQIEETVQQIMKARDFSHAHHLCYQSRVGPVKWLGPSIAETIESLAGQNHKHVLIVPVSFVSDHIETLYELNIEYRTLAESLGIDDYHVMGGLNDSAMFIEALKEVTLQALPNS